MLPTPIISASRSLVIAYVEDHPKAIRILRTAQRRAQEKGVKWRAVFIETPAYLIHSNEGSRERMLRLLTLAEQMGGEIMHIEADTTEKGLAQLFEKEGARIILLVTGTIDAEGKMKHFRRMPWMRIVSFASQYTQVETVPLSGQKYRRSFLEILHLRSIKPLHIIYALLAVGVAYLGAMALESLLPPALFRINERNVGLLFMIACAFAAGRYGLLPGLVASVASFLAVNFYFTVPYPYHALKMNTVTDVLNMVLFLSAALLISLFTSQTRGYGQKVAQREMSTNALFTLYRIASNAFSREQALAKLQYELERMLKVDVAFFLPPPTNSRDIEPAFPEKISLTDADRKALNNCWTEIKTTGIASPFNPGTQWRFEPMISPAGEVGVMGIRPRRKTHLDAWFGRLLTAIADQTASVLEHIDLESSIAETRIREEREKLRSMLLSSVSHDFKTPLAGIIGALSVHRSLGEKLSAHKREELIEAAIEEAQRLDSFITNILDMTRLESGTIQFRKEWHNMQGMINHVTKRLRHRLRQHILTVHSCPANLEVYMDVMMTEQVLQNLLDNACKYTPSGTNIEILCTVTEDQGVLCKVHDHGPGLPPEKMERVFDKYERLHKKDTQVAGTGLGLAISRAVMEAQGGWITAGNDPAGGAVFTLCLPQWRRARLAVAIVGGQHASP